MTTASRVGVKPRQTVRVKSPAKYTPAKGVRERPGGFPKISILFDQRQFNQINEIALASNISFGEQVRCLIDYAFDQLGKEEPS